MKVQITANGQTIDAELTAEQGEKLGLTNKKTGWERERDGKYFAIYTTGNIIDLVDDSVADRQRYEYGNYFTDKALAEKMLKRIGLMLRMQRWADEHNGKIDWNDVDSLKFQISYNCYDKRLFITLHRFNKYFGQIYFSTRELAEQAIEIFGDEIIKSYTNE
jgi:hypothetical protein